jgi:hypothetical protein
VEGHLWSANLAANKHFSTSTPQDNFVFLLHLTRSHQKSVMRMTNRFGESCSTGTEEHDNEVVNVDRGRQKLVFFFLRLQQLRQSHVFVRFPQNYNVDVEICNQQTFLDQIDN